MQASGTLVENNKSGYCALWQENEARLIDYLTKILGQATLAQKVAHDAYVRLQQADQALQLPYPRARLFNLATNLALMHLRRRRMERRATGATLNTEEVDLEVLVGHGAEPGQAALCEQAAEELVRAIKTLAPRLREPLVMAFVQGRHRGDIALQLNISENTVDKRVTKAIRRCRELLAARGISIADSL